MYYAIAVMGDNRTYADDHQAVVDAIVTEMPDLYMNTGDALEFGLDLGQWGGFFNIERELLRIAPLMPAFGNHEAMAGQAYYAGYWHLPNPFDSTELDYAYGYGSSYFIVIDSNSTPKAERLDWLKARLADAQAYPFRFVAFHHPLFTFSYHEPEVAMRAVLHPLFLEAKITAVLNGHNHCYERFVIDGLPYVVTGGGGAPLHSISAHFIEAESAQRVAARTAHHYVMMAFSGLTVTFTVRDTDKDELIETFTLQGNPP